MRIRSREGPSGSALEALRAALLAETERAERRREVTAWYGTATRRWWALVPGTDRRGRLVEANTRGAGGGDRTCLDVVMDRPVRLRCPLSCLGLSQHAYQPLIRVLDGTPGSPATIGDVLEQARVERLGDITGLGPVRRTEVENALRAAGFSIRHDH